MLTVSCSIGYFSQNIWDTLSTFEAIIFLIISLCGSYLFIKDHFSALLNKERMPMLLLAIALFCAQLAFLFRVEGRVSNVLLKTGVGIVYIEFIAVFINLTILRDKMVNSKHIVMYLILCISIPVAVLTTIPYYVQWCGLSGENYKTFVSVYAALIGGGLTLIGVAWTIRKGDKDRKDDLVRRDKEKAEDERKKYKPYFIACDYCKDGDCKTITKDDFIENESFSFVLNERCSVPYIINSWSIRNTKLNAFSIYGFKINNFLINIQPYKFVCQEEIINIVLPRFFVKEEINTISIMVIDILDNVYEVSLGFLLSKQTVLANEQVPVDVLQINANTRPELREEIKV